MTRPPPFCFLRFPLFLDRPPPAPPPSIRLIGMERIIFCISLNCRRRLLTSVVDVPLPFAIRKRRDPSRIVGSSRLGRRHRVDDASMRPTSLSSIWAFLTSLGIPGNIPSTPVSGPIFFSCCSCSRKSSKVNLPC